MIDWNRPTTLRSPLGDLAINTADPGELLYLVNPFRSQARRSHRVASTPISQGDGEILHRRFADGVEFEICLQLWKEAPAGGDATAREPACYEDARLMQEELARHLNAIFNGSGRYLWTPENYPSPRMLHEARWLVGIAEKYANPPDAIELTFTIDSPFPYVIDELEEEIEVSGTEVVTNDGSANFMPVIKVDGPTSAFEIENETTGQRIVYDSGRPGAVAIGGGDYAEIDYFKHTIFLNGDEDRLFAGVDPLQSDLFEIVPGPNTITATGASARFLFNNAWIP